MFGPPRGTEWTDYEVLYLLRTKKVQTALIVAQARALVQEASALLRLARKIDSPLIRRPDE